MYKNTFPLEERKQKSFKMTSLYPDRIPVIVEMSQSSANYTSYINASHKVKYLVPYDITMGQFIKILRDKIVKRKGVKNLCISVINNFINES